MVLSAQTQTTEINIVKNTSTAQQSGQQHKLSEDETAKHYINKCIITPTKKKPEDFRLYSEMCNIIICKNTHCITHRDCCRPDCALSQVTLSFRITACVTQKVASIQATYYMKLIKICS